MNREQRRCKAREQKRFERLVRRANNDMITETGIDIHGHQVLASQIPNEHASAMHKALCAFMPNRDFEVGYSMNNPAFSDIKSSHDEKKHLSGEEILDASERLLQYAHEHGFQITVPYAEANVVLPKS